MTSSLIVSALVACAVPVSAPDGHWRLLGPHWIRKVDALRDQGTRWMSSTPAFTDRGVGCGSLAPGLLQVFKAEFQVPISGPHLAEILSDDYATLSIRDEAGEEVLKLDATTTGQGEYVSQPVVLEAGVRYSVKIENWDAQTQASGVAASIGMVEHPPVLRTGDGPEWTAIVVTRNSP